MVTGKHSFQFHTDLTAREAGELMVNTAAPILKKLINHMEETVNNSSRKYS